MSDIPRGYGSFAFTTRCMESKYILLFFFSNVINARTVVAFRYEARLKLNRRIFLSILIANVRK